MTAPRRMLLFRREPQPPVKGKNLDDGCHAPRLRGHVVFCQQPGGLRGFDWRGENISYTGFLRLGYPSIQNGTGTSAKIHV